MNSRQRNWALLTLIIAGEVIFFLPFVLPRIFRPTLLTVFEITNLQLGTFYSIYGMIAVVAYFFGGPLADRFPPNKLMFASLFFTSIGGLYLFSIPDPVGMSWLYGLWGATTILLFWASLMRVTRVLGGGNGQGIAFGMLDGGRGLVAAIVGAIAVVALSVFLPDPGTPVSPEELRKAFQGVILLFTAIVGVTSVIVFFVLRNISELRSVDRTPVKLSFRAALASSSVRLQALIILCAYSGYRVLDDVSLLAKDVLHYSDVEAASVSSLSLWVRPVAAIGAGFLADRYNASRISMFAFAVMALGGLLIGFGPLELHGNTIVLISVAVTCTGVFALRGLYFAIMQEGQIPLAITGTAVGVASVVGYLPDIYMGPLMGVLLDDHPGELGHRYVFLLATLFALIGFYAARRFNYNVHSSVDKVLSK